MIKKYDFIGVKGVGSNVAKAIMVSEEAFATI
jgi:hypothetical protein